ncbi:MAG: VOC family protein [Armatimonadota bacterium]|nr:VOC family protein [Armatimonadota bacterium]
MSDARQYALDHVVVFVADLDAAARDYAALGFVVVPGGVHAGGVTHNALVPFADGTYLELLAPARPRTARLLRLLGGTPLAPRVVGGSALLRRRVRRIRGGEGLVDFALSCTSLEGVVSSQTGSVRWQREEGGRMRPDGIRLAWSVAYPSEPALPFVIADRTPRSLRVPPAPAHPNGATGIQTVTVAAAAFGRAVDAYGQLLGREPFDAVAPIPDTLAAEFRLGSARIRVVAARGRTHPLREELARRGEGVIGVVLQAAQSHAMNLDVRRAHGASVTLAPGG